MAKSEPAWIFVSHASADLPAVRAVRNHLEQLGAAPLLFHLKSLTRQKEFWPLIEKEIRARTFFLYCESEAAENSEWVRRERQAVAKAARRNPKRIGHIRVDDESIDTTALAAFVAKTRVFVECGQTDAFRASEFEAALANVGFETDVGRAPDRESFMELREWRREEAANSGWILVFLSRQTINGPAPTAHIESAIRLNADRVVPILLDEVHLPPRLAELLAPLRVFNAAKSPRDAPDRLARELLTR